MSRWITLVPRNQGAGSPSSLSPREALSKLKMGFLFPDGDGVARLRFHATNSKKANLSLGFNLVVITAETGLDLARPQPSGPPIAAGHIPGTPDMKTPPPAVEVLMGEGDDNVFGFQPATIVVLNGQTVRWTNVSGKLVNPHTATRAETIDDCAPGQTPPCPASGQDFEFNSGPVPPNGSFTHTVYPATRETVRPLQLSLPPSPPPGHGRTDICESPAAVNVQQSGETQHVASLLFLKPSRFAVTKTS